jgi:predicted dinucleotide-binding enzyme
MPAMTTAIIGTGNIGSAAARHFVAGGEPVILAAKDASGPQALANELGRLASAASVEDAIAEADTVVLAVWLDVIRELIAKDRDDSPARWSSIPRIRSGSTSRVR